MGWRLLFLWISGIHYLEGGTRGMLFHFVLHPPLSAPSLPSRSLKQGGMVKSKPKRKNSLRSRALGTRTPGPKERHAGPGDNHWVTPRSSPPAEVFQTRESSASRKQVGVAPFTDTRTFKRNVSSALRAEVALQSCRCLTQASGEAFLLSA